MCKRQTQLSQLLSLVLLEILKGAVHLLLNLVNFPFFSLLVPFTLLLFQLAKYAGQSVSPSPRLNQTIQSLDIPCDISALSIRSLNPRERDARV
jgi:hypothetical protein